MLDGLNSFNFLLPKSNFKKLQMLLFSVMLSEIRVFQRKLQGFFHSYHNQFSEYSSTSASSWLQPLTPLCPPSSAVCDSCSYGEMQSFLTSTVEILQWGQFLFPFGLGMQIWTTFIAAVQETSSISAPVQVPTSKRYCRVYCSPYNWISLHF